MKEIKKIIIGTILIIVPAISFIIMKHDVMKWAITIVCILALILNIFENYKGE